MDRVRVGAAGRPSTRAFAKAVLGLKMKFLEMMDDDFNTAGAIGALHETGRRGQRASSSVTTWTEQAADDLVAAAAAARADAANLGSVLGLFTAKPAPAAAAAQAATTLPGQADGPDHPAPPGRAGKSKNFALADAIRKGLTDIGITLEDRPDGTRWRKD